jgi:hypothetical protein
MTPSTLEFPVPGEVIRAHLVHTPVACARSYLAGVCVDYGTPGFVHLVSTDGARMLVTRHAMPRGAPKGWPKTVIIPRDVLEPVRAKAKVVVAVTAPRESAVQDLCVTSGVLYLRGMSLDETFPDWRSILPGMDAQEAEGPVTYAPGLLADAMRSHSLITHGTGQTRLIPTTGKMHSTLITIDADSVYLLMPINEASPPLSQLPTWMAGG